MGNTFRMKPNLPPPCRIFYGLGVRYRFSYSRIILDQFNFIIYLYKKYNTKVCRYSPEYVFTSSLLQQIFQNVFLSVPFNIKYIFGTTPLSFQIFFLYLKIAEPKLTSKTLASVRLSSNSKDFLEACRQQLFYCFTFTFKTIKPNILTYCTTCPPRGNSRPRL